MVLLALVVCVQARNPQDVKDLTAVTLPNVLQANVTRHRQTMDQRMTEMTFM